MLAPAHTPNHHIIANTRACAKLSERHKYSTPHQLTIQAHSLVPPPNYCTGPRSYIVREVSNSLYRGTSDASRADSSKSFLSLRDHREPAQTRGQPWVERQKKMTYQGRQTGGQWVCKPTYLVPRMSFAIRSINWWKRARVHKKPCQYVYPSLKIEKLSSFITLINLRNLS